MPLLLVLLPAGCASSLIAESDSEVEAVKIKFIGAVMDANRVQWDCSQNDDYGGDPECAAGPEDPDAMFGGSLDTIIGERDRVLAEKGIVHIGQWTTGSSLEPDTGGIYIPTKPCRLDSLPDTIREKIC